MVVKRIVFSRGAEYVAKKIKICRTIPYIARSTVLHFKDASLGRFRSQETRHSATDPRAAFLKIHFAPTSRSINYHLGPWARVYMMSVRTHIARTCKTVSTVYKRRFNVFDTTDPPATAAIARL